MKKFLIAAIAASVIATPAVAAPNYGSSNAYGRSYQADRNEHRTVTVRKVVKKQPQRVQQRKWAKGQRFDRRYAQNYHVVQDYRQHRLSAPPRGYQWVQSGNDAVLVGIAGGLIGAVIAGILN